MMSRKHLVMLFLSALSLSPLAGCGNDAGTGNNSGASGTVTGDSQGITITAKDNTFDPKSYSAVTGKPIKITITNAGQNIHEVEVKDLFPETKLSPGQSKTMDITSANAGTYKLYCEIHEDEGMEGDFVVK